DHPAVARLHFDRPAVAANYRTGLTIGSRAVQRALGLTGAGVGVAVIDSGLATWHDDFANQSTGLPNVIDGKLPTMPLGSQHLAAFVDFVGGQVVPYDDNGHGTHVTGVIAGNGYDSLGQKVGVAP